MELSKVAKNMKSARGMIFSATVPHFIQKLAVDTFSNPVLLDLVGEEQTQMPKTIKHRVVLCDNEIRQKHLLGDFIRRNPDKKTIVFTETKFDADQIASMKYANFKALHGDMDQRFRQEAINKFREKGSGVVLVATDVAARGLDIDDVEVIIHLGCRNVDSFVHRSGRTGRAGRKGLNFVIVKRSELALFNKFSNDLNIDMEVGVTLLDDVHDK